MADEIDRAQEIEEMHRAHSIRAALRPIPAGEPGECDSCGTHSPRLINGNCAPCRDEYGLA